MIEWSQYPNFKAAKFNCQCPKCAKQTGAENMCGDLLTALQRIRTQLDKPMIVTSGYRCREHPLEKKKIAAGRKRGSHTYGTAVDIACNGEKAFEIMRLAVNSGVFHRIGVKQKGAIKSRFLHLQVRGGRAAFDSKTIFSY